MKKLGMLMAVCLAFTLTMLAQEASPADQGANSTASGQTTTDTNSKATMKSSGKKARREGKEHSMTGCLSGPNSEGAYVLTNGRYKKGLEVGGNDELKNHVGHEVKVTGTWSSASDIGENESAEKNESAKMEKGEKKESKERHFKVSKIDMVSDHCTATASAGKKSKKSKAADSMEKPPSQ
ncbi:MAG TPA: hypothetical protein VFA76_04125 [Terriglobales bacterium]|nr:hypothetical protein [Terriglobales bacterium]